MFGSGTLLDMSRNFLVPFAIVGLVLTSIVSPLRAGEGKPFRFPGGDPEAGEKAFVALNCVQCHTVAEVNLAEPKGKKILELPLASHPRFVKNYEDLIRAIVNPKHVVSEQYQAILSAPELRGEIEPLMPDLTRDMSARQLVDLVAFLDQAYKGSLQGYGE